MSRSKRSSRIRTESRDDLLADIVWPDTFDVDLFMLEPFDLERQLNFEYYGRPSTSHSSQQTRQERSMTMYSANTAITTDSQDLYVTGWRLYIMMLTLGLALFLGVIDASIVATALLSIGNYFDNFLQLQWVVLAYLLTDLGFAFIFARLSDVIGRKWTSIIAIVILTLSSLACGLAQSLDQLIIFRVFQGIGGSGAYTMPFTVLPEITPPEQLTLLTALPGLIFVVASVLGPILGGIITTHSSWRWVFLFNVPFGVFIIGLMLFCWPKNRPAGRITWRQLDVIGTILSIAALVLVIFAMQEAGQTSYAWSSPLIITTLTVSGVSAISLFFWIRYLSKGSHLFEPLFPARVVTHRVLGVNAVYSALVGYVFFTVIVGLPERFQLVNRTSAQTAGVNLLPLLGSTGFSSIIVGGLSRMKNRGFLTINFSSALMVVGAALLSTVGSGVRIPHAVYWYQVILGLGIGGALTSTVLMIKLNATAEDAASAQGLQSQARLFGGNVGLAVATIILNRDLGKDLEGILTPQQISDVRRSLNALKLLTPAQVAAVANTFAHAFRRELQICIGVAGASLIFGLLTWQRNPPSFASLAAEREKNEKKKISDSAAMKLQLRRVEEKLYSIEYR